MFNREYGLVHNPSDPERFVRLVKWERRWTPFQDAEGPYESLSLFPTVWDYTPLDVSNPRALDYSGPEIQLVPTAITSLEWTARGGFPMRFTWPREAPSETEETRRMRIRELRRVCHVDEQVGMTEPTWIADRGDRAKIQNQWMAPEHAAA